MLRVPSPTISNVDANTTADTTTENNQRRTKNKIMLLEYASTAYTSSSSAAGSGIWENLNLKFPAIFVLIIIVIGYMMWNK